MKGWENRLFARRAISRIPEENKQVRITYHRIGIQTEEANLSILNIRLGQSCATEARQGVKEFHAAVTQADMELVVSFCSSEYDLEVPDAEESGSL